jgi:hypothetical protein
MTIWPSAPRFERNRVVHLRVSFHDDAKSTKSIARIRSIRYTHAAVSPCFAHCRIRSSSSHGTGHCRTSHSRRHCPTRQDTSGALRQRMCCFTMAVWATAYFFICVIVIWFACGVPRIGFRLRSVMKISPGWSLLQKNWTTYSSWQGPESTRTGNVDLTSIRLNFRFGKFMLTPGMNEYDWTSASDLASTSDPG